MADTWNAVLQEIQGKTIKSVEHKFSKATIYFEDGTNLKIDLSFDKVTFKLEETTP